MQLGRKTSAFAVCPPSALCFAKISITLVTHNLVEKIVFSLFVGIDCETRLSVAGLVSIGIHDFPFDAHY